MNPLIRLTKYAKDRPALFINAALIVNAIPKTSRVKEKYTELIMMGEDARYLVSESPEKINELAAAANYNTQLAQLTKKDGKTFVWVNPALIIGADAKREGDSQFTFLSLPTGTIVVAEWPEHLNIILERLRKTKSP